MPDSYPRPRTTPCPVRLRMCDGSTVEGVVWLLPDAARSSGFTSVQALLEGPRQFIAVGLGRGGSILVNRESIVTAEVAADGPGVADVDDGASFDVITLRLDSGEEIAGVLRAVARVGAERMSDVFNAASRFVALGAGDKVVLAARDRIVKVAF